MLKEFPKKASLILWLTATDSKLRPTAKELLERCVAASGQPTLSGPSDVAEQLTILLGTANIRVAKLERENKKLRMQLAELKAAK